MIIVTVLVWEPGNPEAGTIDEWITTGTYHGFKTEKEAEDWSEIVLARWGNPSNTKMSISSSEHFSELYNYQDIN